MKLSNISLPLGDIPLLLYPRFRFVLCQLKATIVFVCCCVVATHACSITSMWMQYNAVSSLQAQLPSKSTYERGLVHKILVHLSSGNVGSVIPMLLAIACRKVWNM